jgi:hypothetical protein
MSIMSMNGTPYVLTEVLCIEHEIFGDCFMERIEAVESLVNGDRRPRTATGFMSRLAGYSNLFKAVTVHFAVGIALVAILC